MNSSLLVKVRTSTLSYNNLLNQVSTPRPRCSFPNFVTMSHCVPPKAASIDSNVEHYRKRMSLLLRAKLCYSRRVEGNNF